MNWTKTTARSRTVRSHFKEAGLKDGSHWKGKESRDI